MELKIPIRAWMAFLVAPVAPVLALTTSTAAMLVVMGEPMGPVLAGALRGSLNVAALVLPVAYLVEALVGVPLYLALRKREGLGQWRVVIVAAVVGALVVPIMLPVFQQAGREWWMIPLGGLVGAGTGALLLGFAEPRPGS